MKTRNVKIYETWAEFIENFKKDSKGKDVYLCVEDGGVWFSGKNASEFEFDQKLEKVGEYDLIKTMFNLHGIKIHFT